MEVFHGRHVSSATLKCKHANHVEKKLHLTKALIIYTCIALVVLGVYMFSSSGSSVHVQTGTY